MNEKALRKEIDEKIQGLTEENRKVYEDMLAYLRLSYNKSERETEEILLELLNHLLEAQKAGKSAEEIFGPDPKRLAQQIVGELPALIPSKWWLMIAMGAAYFFAVHALLSGGFDLVMYLLGKGSWIQEVHVGSVVAKSVVSLMIGFGFALLILHYMRWSCFRDIRKAEEMLITGLFAIVPTGAFMAVIYLIPPIGPVLTVPLYASLIIGAGLFMLGYKLQKAL
ncbi:Uncharacterized membrane-anchored protein [Planifilum fulgidum]|uniref:Uncharacterized membrane-anchored protein n=1 Tax=Planifilum fulgidum TaxID=201973 RepID=A0A1I2QPZ3_9BACL|nr:DUF1129 family protein [Planifilum fulgidum]SFG28327.1 Uncharacterized membrane-anchored protein [Planifilum fulgidum]